MLQRLVEQKNALIATMASIKNSPQTPSSDQWNLMADAVECLQPYYEATDEMSGDQSLTASKIIPITKQLMTITSKKLTACDKEDPSMATKHELLQALLKNTRDRFSSQLSMKQMTLSTLIDPRFKHIALQTQNGSALQSEPVKQLEAEVKAVFASEGGETVTDLSSPAPETEASPGTSLWEAFDTQAKSQITTQNPTAVAIMEVHNYVAEPVMDRKTNPFGYWETNKGKFPRLSKVILKYGCLVATSVPSERVFSKTGELISHRRSCLKSNMVDKIIFLNKN